MRTWAQFCQEKIICPTDLEKKIREIRALNQTIATLNGSFDLLHAGHMYMVYEASQVADVLIMALNSDASIKAYKCEKRPIIPLKYRLEMLAALKFVDYLTWFDEVDPRQILEKIKPDVHVNGSEYGENCIEAEVVKKHNGRLHLVERIPGLSTTQILKSIHGKFACD